jgi:hypothetical protein
MFNASGEKIKSEEQRAELAKRCNDVVGGNQQLLATVISFFPDLAELFIKTQEHAFKIEGKKSVWYRVMHKKRGYGLDGNERYEEGQYEYLGTHGFTGKYIMNTIGAIHKFRGLDEIGEAGYLLSLDELLSILKFANQPKNKLDIWGQIAKKTLEVMDLTKEELALINNQVESYKKADNIRKRADALNAEAQRLNTEADEILRKANTSINQRYPRS